MLIAQITDSILSLKVTIGSMKLLQRLCERLERAVIYLNDLNPRPDGVLLTGDASDLGTSVSYLHLLELLEPLKIPCYIIPGNPDCRVGLRQAFSKDSYEPILIKFFVDF